jgi:hypothetical protein
MASSDSAAFEVMMSTSIKVVTAWAHIEAREVAKSDENLELSVTVNGRYLGNASLPGYYEPRIAVINSRFALWSGARIYVVDTVGTELKQFEWDDEVRRIYSFGDQWCVQGEISVMLFEPETQRVFARYDHNEVIVDSDLFCDHLEMTDFSGRRITLDLPSGLRPVVE